MSAVRSSVPRPVRIAASLFRAGQRLYPAAFRREFNEEMVTAFVQAAIAAWRRRGLRGLLGRTGSALADHVRGGLSERFAALAGSGDGARPLSPAPDQARRRRAALALRNDPPTLRLPTMDDLLQDLRFAVRSLRRSPGFAAAVVATIALGVGANTTIFTLVNGIVLRPLPFADSERAVVLCETHPSAGDYCIASPPNVRDWGARLPDELEAVGVARTWTYSMRDDQGATNVSAGIATPGYLTVHGAHAQLGRLLQERDLADGSNRVVVLSHGLWQGRFAGDPEIIGRSVVMDAQAFTVIGVLAADTWVSSFDWVQAWTPISATPEDTDQRGWRGFSAVGLLTEGTTLERARERLAAVRLGLEQEYAQDNQGWGLHVERLRDHVAGPVRPTLLIFTAAVACVLLIGCANVANLLLVRATERVPEFAVRASLGAGRTRLIRQVLTESALLASIGGLLGLALATVATEGFLGLAPTDIPRLDEVGIDLRVLVFTGAVSLATAVLFGLVPALRAARTDLNESLKSARHSPGGRRLRDALVVGQLAMALILLIVAGLLARSFATLLAWDPGFERGGLVTVWSFADMGHFETGQQIVAALDSVAEEIGAVPGVVAVGQTSAGPLFGGRETSVMAIEGRPPVSPDQMPSVRWYDIDPDYFATMGIPLVRGRGFSDADDVAAVPVAIVNEAFAKRHFTSGEAIGERVTVDQRTMQIVGIVADVRPFRPDEPALPEIYYPRHQFPRGGTYYVIRSLLPLPGLEQQIRERVEREVPEVTLSSFQTLDERADRELVSPRFNMALLALFALVAIILAAVGIYGVIAHAVASRTHEIGVRVALGARPASITVSILRSGLARAVIGVTLGVAVALAAGQVLTTQLYGLSARDLPTYALVVAMVLGVAVLASLIPARRAARLDPIAALRSE